MLIAKSSEDSVKRNLDASLGAPTCNVNILRFHCHSINTTQKNTSETVQWKKPRK